jgi:hypothetical protein
MELYKFVKINNFFGNFQLLMTILVIKQINLLYNLNILNLHKQIH